MPTAIALTPFTPEETPAIARLAREIWDLSYTGLIPAAQIDYMLAERYAEARLNAEIADPNKWLMQAIVDGERAGFGCGELCHGEFKLDKLYVHPRFQRLGVGRALVDWMSAKARQLGYPRLILAVYKGNEAAKQAYRRMGFSLREAVELDIGEGFIMDDYLLEKPTGVRLDFVKMQGLGNDFLVLDGVRQAVHLTPALIRRLADRHFGVGFDQLLLVEATTRADADFRYRIFNADGEEVEQCGNGARCFARFVYEQGLSQKTEIRVETQKGVIAPRLLADGEVAVDMGPPRFAPADLPFTGDTVERLVYPLVVAGEKLEVALVSMGNPHVVLVVPSLEATPVARLGAALESHPAFPARANVGFLEIVDRHTAKLRVFERGVGETLACGTGACAAAVTGIRRGLLDSPVRVEMPGGSLSITWDQAGAPVWMTGPAVTVFTGAIEP